MRASNRLLDYKALALDDDGERAKRGQKLTSKKSGHQRTRRSSLPANVFTRARSLALLLVSLEGVARRGRGAIIVERRRRRRLCIGAANFRRWCGGEQNGDSR